MTQNIILYHRATCPYCRRVRDYIAGRKIEVPMLDISEDKEARELLIGIGGRGQVPCLVIDGKALYESDHIIEWMEANLS